MDLLLKMQNLRILVNEKWYISTLVWSRGMVFSQCLENNTVYEMSEGIFDILISYQKMGVQTKKIFSEIEHFHFSTIKNPSTIFKKIPLTLPRFCHKISKSALILFLSFSEVEKYQFPATLYIAYIWRPFWILRGSVTLNIFLKFTFLMSSIMYNIKCLQPLLLFFIFEPPYLAISTRKR